MGCSCCHFLVKVTAQGEPTERDTKGSLPHGGDWNELEVQGLRLRQMLDSPCHGFRMWPSALLLSAYVAEALGEAHLRGRSAVELAAGCGLVGLVAASLGAEVTLTDLPYMTQHLEGNARLNVAKAPAVTACDLCFGSDVRDRFTRGAFDFILLSDATYSWELTQQLIATLLQLASDETIVLLACPSRIPQVQAKFKGELLSYFEVEPVQVSAEAYDRWVGAAQLSKLNSLSGLETCEILKATLLPSIAANVDVHTEALLAKINNRSSACLACGGLGCGLCSQKD
mmetsp:Transcript_75388/g.195991  ORF Transcript_75388/g.195991 Transcript_75388/m.195991 type:complete len:285 (+) Transcript_75388:66-920(+)